MLRRVWAKRGRRPVAAVEPRYEWLYVYGFVRPASGATEWFLGDRVNTALFAAVLARFASAQRSGPARARRRSWSATTPPAGTRASTSPRPRGCGRCSSRPVRARAPQPAERLGPLARGAVANRHFASLAELDRALAERRLALADQPEAVKAHTHFRWWPAAA